MLTRVGGSCRRSGASKLTYGLLALLLSLSFCHRPSSNVLVTAYYATSSTVLLTQAKGVVTNAYGPVKARVSTALSLTLQFGLVAGTGYVAGTVTVTTNAKGQVIKVAKGTQSCKVVYTSAGAVKSVTCSTGRRMKLGRTGPPEAQVEDESDEGSVQERDQDVEVEGEGSVTARRLDSMPCSSCVNLVTSAFNRTLKGAFCGTSFTSKIPTSYRWAKAASTALCSMSSKLGAPSALANNTCKCCILNSACPSGGVCSAGICLAQKIATGAACPDGEDDDCGNGVCGMSVFPGGPYVCCPSGDYHGSYCSAQVSGASCGMNTMCASGICSAGICIDAKIVTGAECPDGEDDDCANGACGRSPYPDGGYVCCPSGRNVVSPSNGDSYCTQTQGPQGPRLPCDSNEMCSSGVCSEGICLPQRIGANQSCPDVDDNDCASGTCARSTYPKGEYVCCDDSRYDVFSYDESLSFRSPKTMDYYCAQEPGESCDTNEMCSSGVCSAGVCLAQKLGAGVACPERRNSDCAKGSCALSSYPNGSYVCCASGRFVFSPRTTFRYCTGSQEAGGPCEKNEICSSGACLGGVCLAQKLGDGAPCPDKDDDDCANSRCARGSYSNGSYVCCRSGDVVSAYAASLQAYSRYCTGIQGAGASCDSNEICSSGACLGGVCLAQKIPTGAPCPDGDDVDCANGVCGRSSYPNGGYVCCQSGNSTDWSSDTYCTGQAPGSACGSNTMCSSGVCSAGICLTQRLGTGAACPDGDNDCANGACGKSSYPNGGYVCCPSGERTSRYCTGTQGVGSSCDTNEICSSGVCSSRICRAQKLNAGAPCPDGEDDDCANGVCGRSSYPSGGYVCCPSANMWGWYCTGQAPGSPCGRNAMCSSGVCSAGICLTQRIGAGAACPDGEDDDCANGACGKSSYPSGGYVCCPSGKGTTWFWGDEYCTGQAPGSACFSNAMCSSGVCSAGICLTQKIGDGAPCPDRENDDCANRACGKSSYPSGGDVCCPSGNTTVSPTYFVGYCTGTQGIGSLCDTNEMCSSGVCSAGFCRSQRLATGSACPDFEDSDCANSHCARSSYPSGGYVCCPSGSYVYSSAKFDWYCTGTQGRGSPCDANAMCVSRVCSGGVCSA